MTELPKRKNIRLKNYDYSLNGAYFITICTQQRLHLFGKIEKYVRQGLCSCRFTPTGEVIEKEWRSLFERYPNIIFDNFVVMPNHIHAIIIINFVERQEQSPCPTISDIICVYKSITTKICNINDGVLGRKIWQFRFHDRIIRNESEYRKIWCYINENPTKWEEDCYNK